MTVFIAGDSTFQYNNSSTYPQTGIGQMLPLFFRNLDQPDLGDKDIVQSDAKDISSEDSRGETVTFRNYARNGRSTKSFIDEERLAHIEEELQPGDYLLVCFGHNDEKTQDPARYTDPETTYKENLKIFAQAAEKKGAFPIFITPVSRRAFNQNNGLPEDTHQAYSSAMTAFAMENGYPIIDLTALSQELLLNLGEEGCQHLYMNFPAGIHHNYPEGKEDNTHLTPDGAYAYASLTSKCIWFVCGRWNGRNSEAYRKLASFIRDPKE